MKVFRIHPSLCHFPPADLISNAPAFIDLKFTGETLQVTQGMIYSCIPAATVKCLTSKQVQNDQRCCLSVLWYATIWVSTIYSTAWKLLSQEISRAICMHFPQEVPFSSLSTTIILHLRGWLTWDIAVSGCPFRWSGCDKHLNYSLWQFVIKQPSWS